MSISKEIKIQGYIDFPRQKLSDKEKTDDWYKKNVDYAENLLSSDTNLRANFVNKKTNYNLRANIINMKDVEKIINPDKLDLETLPASFQHIGIENTKIMLLLGEYADRRRDWKVYLSSGDKEGIGRKEKELFEQIKKELSNIITAPDISEQEIQKRLEDLNKYQSYEFQDIAEIAANRILRREYNELDLDFLFLTTFEDLLTAGEQIVCCEVLSGEPVIRRVNPMNLYTLGGNSMKIEDADIIVEFGYRSVGQVIDDYYEELKPEDIDFLETGNQNTKLSNGIGLNRDISIYDMYGETNALTIFNPNELGLRTFAGAFDTYGNVRVIKVCWRSRRKIGKLKYFDEDGQEQTDYVTEDYQIRKELGEEVKWQWVNEWLEATKIADDIYVNMRPVPYSSASMVNKSKGSGPYIGSINSTNDYKVQSLMDIMKPLTYSYDIAYYKRELEIATYKGSFAAINLAMVPSGWDPEKWMRYVTINKFAWLDPTNEILKGPAQGKSAGHFNQITATNVKMGDTEAIQMFTNLLFDIETTLGKLAGVTGGREGQIEKREAVNNVEREIVQTSHITEKWFAVDNNFRKRVLTKFLECCKYAYKMNPKRGQFILDDMSQEVINNITAFASSEFDLHISNSKSDTELYRDVQALSQAAIQNGQATISDLITIRQNSSVQSMARKLEDSAKRIAEQQNAAVQERNEIERQRMEMEQRNKDIDRQIDIQEKDKDRQLEREKIQSNLEIAHLKEIGNDVRQTSSFERDDSDKNGIDDYIDTRRTDIDERFKVEKINIDKGKLQEQIRSNKAKESIAKSKNNNSKT